MKKIFVTIMFMFLSYVCFGQVAEYGKLTYDCQSGFFFDGISLNEPMFIATNKEFAIKEIKSLIEMCNTDGDNLIMTYNDLYGNKYLVVKQEKKTSKNKFGKWLYIMPYGYNGTWRILEEELNEILIMLNNFGRKRLV